MGTKHNDTYDHVLKYTGVFGGVQGLTIMIGLVRNKFMALLLGAGGMGFNALLTSVQNFAAQCTNLGISFGAVPKLSEYYEKDQQASIRYYIQVIRLWSLLAAVLGIVFCVTVSPLVNRVSFSWGNHTHHYALLALAVAMAAISGGETAILKATRQLGALARIQIYTAIASVVVTVPLYYFFYHSGVAPAIVLMAGVAMLTTVAYSYRRYPLKLGFTKDMLKQGGCMIRLGLAFVLAAVIGSMAEMLIRSYLNVEGSLDDVGLYNAGFMMTMTYAGMVFSAMESDYFPRLSAVHDDVKATNETVNRQMEVSLLLLSPMLVALLMMLPVLIPLLFSKEFVPVVQMAQVATLAMYLKVMTLPVAYITLARSYSLAYLLLESFYYLVFVASVILGFRYGGIYGTGVAIVVAHVFDYFLINGFAYWKYQYRCTSTVMRYASVQVALGLAAFACSCVAEGWGYWIIEAVLVVVSTAYSVYVLRRKARLWESLRQRFSRHF